MARIPAIFAEHRRLGRKAIMPFICGGHPGPGDTARLLPAMQEAGAAIVEVGFPFSDPIADGPVIAAAMHEALQRGATPRTVLDEIANVRSRITLGVVAMVSVSIVQRIGSGRFVADAKAAGIDGFIFPDCPVEESEALLGLVRDAGLTAALLVAPTSTPKRTERIVRASSGFVYLLARVGITGTGDTIPDIAPRVQELRQMTDLPIACGFGVSTPEHVRAVTHTGGADAAIVGSALVKHIAQTHATAGDAIKAAGQFVRVLHAGLQENSPNGLANA